MGGLRTICYRLNYFYVAYNETTKYISFSFFVGQSFTENKNVIELSVNKQILKFITNIKKKMKKYLIQLRGELMLCDFL